MKKLIAILLTVAMSFSMCSLVMATESDEMNVVYDAISEDGIRTKILSEKVDEYTTRLYSYTDGELTDVVTRTYDENRESFSLQVEEVSDGIAVTTEVITKELSTSEPIVPLDHGTIAEYEMGTMHYIGGNLNLGVRLTCTTNYLTNTTYEKDTAGTLVVRFISELAGELDLSEKAIGEFVESPMFKIFGRVLGGTIEWLTTKKLEAISYDHRIFGEQIGNESNDGWLSGESFYITEEGEDFNENFLYGYTPFHWGTAYLGQAMFYELFGVEYTPTSWQQAA